MKKQSTRQLVLAALFLALGLLMPFLTGQIPSLGNKLLPMHIPILLCGFICGWQYGLAVGFIAPLFRSMLFGMPPMFPTALAMAFELAAYGLIAGYLYKIFPKKNISVYFTLFIAMFVGRIVWGVASLALYGLNGTVFAWKMFIAGALVNAIPGIIIQIIIIPIIIIALQKTKYLK